MNVSTFSRFSLSLLPLAASAYSLGKNHFAIKKGDGKKRREGKRFVTNELPLKVTSQYTLIKSESISNGREIYVLCCFPSSNSQSHRGKCGNYAEMLVKGIFFLLVS